MDFEIRWILSQSASCFYAADLLRRGRATTDPKLAAAIAEPVELLRHEVLLSEIDEAQFWSHLLPQAARIENNRQLADVVLRKSIGSGARADAALDRIAGRIADVEAAVSRAMPKLVERLNDAAGPIKEAWAIHGDGLLERVGRATDERLIVSSAEVILVHPAAGGGGIAHLLYNSATIEVVECDPHAELPEWLRLAWLLSQLNVDLPMFSENIAPARRPLVAALAMLPATLAAAEEVELARCEPATIRRAIEAWDVAGSAGVDPAGVDLTDVAWQWWETYADSRPPWNVALAALDQMIG